ncbi:hypothetical protein BG58_40945 [Caballeronia jiangsuensis]|nr:hypothetical protein BG58_40945 [Caballeronia jiangsuensis]
MIKKALSVTGRFEDSENPFGAVSGNFDGMGISLGVLQWNIGSNSLQPLLKAVPRDTIRELCPKCGIELIQAANESPADGLDIVRRWQPGGTLPPAYKSELQALAESDAFVREQVIAANHVASRAYQKCDEWCHVWGMQADTHAFCWFFDVYTQNGGVGTLTAQQVVDFAQTPSSFALVIQWLLSRTKADSGYKDAMRNAPLWSGGVLPNSKKLFAASYLRSQTARAQWRVDVMNRKGTLAIGHGWVHGDEWKIDFDAPPEN